MKLCSDDYAKLQQELLDTNSSYGTSSSEYKDVISDLINTNKFTKVLDYGTGKANLTKGLDLNHNINMRCYDPCVPQFANPPQESAELVCCIDVLESVEPEYLDGVLDHIKSLTDQLVMFVITCGPSNSVLSDGRNANLTQQASGWWLPKILQRFDIDHFIKDSKGFLALALPKGV